MNFSLPFKSDFAHHQRVNEVQYALFNEPIKLLINIG